MTIVAMVKKNNTLNKTISDDNICPIATNQSDSANETIHDVSINLFLDFIN